MIIILKDIDKKILRELLIDGRIDFTALAKKLNVTSKTVWNRYKILKTNKVIIGATTHVNYKKCYGIFTVFSVKMPPNQNDNVIENIQKLPKVYTVSKGLKNDELIVGITVKNINEIDTVRNTLSSLTLSDEITSEIWLEVKNIPENLKTFAVKKQKQPNIENKIDNKKITYYKEIKLDKIDFKLIDLLSIDGRMSFSKISRKIGKSIDTIIKRYNKLVNHNILKVVIQINPIEIGYKGWMIFNLSFSAKFLLQEKIEEIIKIPDIIHLVKTKGLFDIVVYAFVRDIDQLFEIQKRIIGINGLNNFEIRNNEILDTWPTPKQCKSTF